VNYANLTKGFLLLLKRDTPFVWDEKAHESFDALTKALVSTPFLKPPNYSRDYLLYIAVSEGKVGVTPPATQAGPCYLVEPLDFICRKYKT
jgi:hypothetical protein